MSSNQVPYDIQAIEQQKQRRFILEARKAGMSHDLIAEELGVTRNYVAVILKKELETQRTLADQGVEELKQLERERLDEVIKSLWPDVQKGKYKAIELLIKVMERRAKMEGIDAPERQVSIDLTSQLERLSPQELLTEAQRLGLPLPEPPQVELLPLPGEQLNDKS